MKSYYNGPNNRVGPNKRVGSIKFASGTQLIINSILSVKRFMRTVVKDTWLLEFVMKLQSVVLHEKKLLLLYALLFTHHGRTVKIGHFRRARMISHDSSIISPRG